MLFYSLAAVLFIGIFYLIARASRRFEEQQKDLGRWDDEGPLEETEAPPLGARGNVMDWRLETLGLWPRRVLRRRRPHRHPEHPDHGSRPPGAQD